MADARNLKVRQFKSRLTRLKNKGDNAGIVALWEEFQRWCDFNAYPDNWRLWEQAAEVARLQMKRASWVRL